MMQHLVRVFPQLCFCGSVLSKPSCRVCLMNSAVVSAIFHSFKPFIHGAKVKHRANISLMNILTQGYFDRDECCIEARSQHKVAQKNKS